MMDPGFGALALFERKRPDVALLDIAMPGMGGVEVLRRLKAIDDDPSVSDVLRDLLKMKGYQARIVADAASALREVPSTSPPDIILLDINLPGLSGLNVLPAIHQLAPRTIVMLISGVMDDDAFKRARTYGAFDFFTKPIDIDDLTRSIEMAFGLG